MNAAVLGIWGENITVFSPSGAKMITAAFDNEYISTDAGGYAIDEPHPALFAKKSDWDALGAAKGIHVRRGDITYTVVDIQSDETDAVIVMLRAYDPDSS